MVIQDIQEVSQYIEVKFEVSLQWRDARVLFYNIKQDEEMNTLTMDEQVSLWTPTLVFWNTKHQLRTINDKNTFASIRQEGNGSMIEKENNEDILVFQGSENSILLSRVYSIQFYCTRVNANDNHLTCVTLADVLRGVPTFPEAFHPAILRVQLPLHLPALELCK